MADKPGIAPIKKPTAPAPPLPPRPPGLATHTRWEEEIVRAIYQGERRINTLLSKGRNAGGSDDKKVRTAVLKFLQVPFPPGGTECERQRTEKASARPDKPDTPFTGRYESIEVSTKTRYFWAINQAGNAVVAIRTMRDYSQSDNGDRSQKYLELRGDLQGNGTALLFVTNDPGKFWGYLQWREGVRTNLRWQFGSYLGADGQRVDVERSSEYDESLQLANERPTMMKSLWYQPDDHSLSVLLQDREWYPLTRERYQFLESGARSDLLRSLLTDYLKTPEGFNGEQKREKDAAAQRLVNYVAILLWDGQRGTRVSTLSLPPVLKDAYRKEVAAYLERADAIMYGHHNNLALATHVAKTWLAHVMLDHAGVKRSFLDWLVEVAHKRQTAELNGPTQAKNLSRLLEIPLDRSAGTYRYRIKLELFKFLGFRVEGTLIVEPLTDPKWGPTRYEVAGWWIGSPVIFPEHDVVFELEKETSQQWLKEDFEGTLYVGEVGLGVETPWVDFDLLDLHGAFLKSKNGLLLEIEDWGGPSAGPGTGQKPKKPWKLSGGAVRASVSLSKSKLIDLSKPYPDRKELTRNLESAAHFCFGDSFLTAAGRQLLRLVCADQLAALSSKTVEISIIGHTDRPANDQFNRILSVRRAENVKTALVDILGKAPKGKLQIDERDILTLGFGELEAKIADWLKLVPDRTAERMRNPHQRRVDLLINATLVATFREHT